MFSFLLPNDVVPGPSDEQQSTLTDFFFSFPTVGIAGVKEGVAEASL